MEFINLKKQYNVHKNKIISSLQNTLKHGQYILGPEVYELEKKLSKFTGSKYCIAVSSGTDALLISLMSLGIKKGDEVITTPFSYIASTEVICLLGATPVFVDVEKDTCNINSKKIEKKITKNTRVILAVSLFGQTADFKSINKIARKYKNITVVEDAAQSFGAEHYEKKSCNLSTIGCTSFFPTKILGCYGDGGAIFTNKKNLFEKCVKIREHGQSKKYVHDLVGVSGRLDNIQASILLTKFNFLQKEILSRIKLANLFNKKIDMLTKKYGKQKIIRIKKLKSFKKVYSQYTIIASKRDELRNFLQKNSIPTKIYYPLPINLQKPYKKYSHNDLKISLELSKKVISLPFHPYLEKKEINKIFNLLDKFFLLNFNKL